MSWRDTWRATVESFLRELRDPDAGPAGSVTDPVVEAIASARAELASVEQELASVESRLTAEVDAAAVCDRRREQAERIGDIDTARIAGSFGRRHVMRAAVLRRKLSVLEEELVLARAALNDLLDYARADVAPMARRTGQPRER